MNMGTKQLEASRSGYGAMPPMKDCMRVVRFGLPGR
jgi:hypothetical protein